MIQSFLPLHPDFHRNYVQELPNIFSIWYNMYIIKPMWLFCTVLSVKNMLPLLSHFAQKSPSPWKLPTSNYQADWLLLPLYWKVKVKVLQLCPTLCDPMDYRVHGILWARILKAIPFSIGGRWIILEVLFNPWVAFWKIKLCPA